MLRETAAGLADVHALDMVHRDVKPSNVMLTLDGVTLIDFGVARAAEQSQVTRTGMVVGTPAYMSPEQASGRGAPPAPLTSSRSVRCWRTRAAAGPPFGDESGHGVLYRIVHEAPDLTALRALDAELADVVAACLDKDPDGRPTARAGTGPATAPAARCPPGPRAGPQPREAPGPRTGPPAVRAVRAVDPRPAVRRTAARRRGPGAVDRRRPPSCSRTPRTASA
ncbi:protein kinase domain-containing protein [Streptomyces zhihengii]